MVGDIYIMIVQDMITMIEDCQSLHLTIIFQKSMLRFNKGQTKPAIKSGLSGALTGSPGNHDWHSMAKYNSAGNCSVDKESLLFYYCMLSYVPYANKHLYIFQTNLLVC